MRVTPFLILLILLCQISLGHSGSDEDGTITAFVMDKMHVRKLLVEVTMDYDYGGPNTRHDPKKGKPGIGGKNL